MRSCPLILLIVALCAWYPPNGNAQTGSFPFIERFDTVAQPALPTGWLSTQSITPGTNDFTTSSSTPFSSPNAVVSTNARISQALTSPLFNFTAHIPDSISFVVRRTGTHTSPVVVEASLDSGTTFTLLIGDTLYNPGHTNYARRAFPLPPQLSSREGTRFRWRIIADPSGGTTGTFRLDDVAVTARSPVDLTLTRIASRPLLPTEDDSVTIEVTTTNTGEQGVSGFRVDLFIDANNDSLPQPAELLGSALISVTLPPMDSVVTAFGLGVRPPGTILLIAVVDHPPDQNPANNVKRLMLQTGYRVRSIVVNEIMYAPINTEPEWVEVYNTRQDSIDLRGWLISDNIATNKRVLTTSSVWIPPAGYTVLTRDSAALLDVHPSMTARVIQVIGFPTLNNTGDAVVLYDNRVVTMDSLSYLPAWGGSSGGRSLERIDPLEPSTTSANWGTSLAPQRSTPGERNSVTRKDFDLSIDTAIVAPVFPTRNDTMHITIAIRNRGIQPASNFALTFYEDLNADSLAQPDERLDSIQVATELAPLSVIELTVRVMPAVGSERHFIAWVAYSPDEDLMNNTRRTTITVGHVAGSIRINEIMYAPTGGIPEWVELINTSQDSVDLRQWRLGNRQNRYVIGTGSLLLPPDNLLVITKDTALFRAAYPTNPGAILQVASLPTFLWNNSGDAAVVADNRNLLMDSIHYLSTWGGSGGTSLERIDPFGPSLDSINWTSSIDSLGSTPGRPNSLVALDHDLALTRAQASAVLPGTAASIMLTVRNAGRIPSGAFTLRLFDDADGDSLGSGSEVVAEVSVSQTLARWDTLSLHATWVSPPPGLRRVIAIIHYLPDERTANNVSFLTVKVGYPPKAFVINEIMYAPLTGNAEYVEFMNASDHAVDVMDWVIRDMPSSTGAVNVFRLSRVPRQVGPGEYVVLASDSSIFRTFPQLMDGALVTIAGQSSLSLNNEGDAVTLIDIAGGVIDSVAYIPAWHNPGVQDTRGRSLERIHHTLVSHDARSWSTSAHPAGGTPGRKNSIAASTLPQKSRLSALPNPFSPDADARDDHTIIRYEVALQVSMIRVRIYDARGRLIRTLANNEPSGPEGMLVWDGSDDSGRKARMGIYVISLEAIDDRGGVLETAKGTVVLAGRLSR